MTYHKMTIKDIAKEAHVSTATVSNYINHKTKLMSKPTYRRVKRIVLKYHYVPSTNASQLKNKKAKIIAFFAADITDYFSVEMFKGVTYELEKYNFHTMLLNSNSNFKEEKNNILSLDTNLLAGLVIQPLNNNFEFLRDSIFSNIPTIILDREIPNSQYPSIVTNNFYITRKACRYFKHSKNLNKVILISNELPNVSTIKQRKLGINHVYAEQDVKVIDPGKSKTSFDIAYRHLKKEIKKHPNSLVFAIKERWLLEFLPRLMYDGLVGKGKETGVTGFSDSNLINIIDPKIKVIRQYPFAIGKKAGEVLVNKLNKKEVVKFNRIVIPASFNDFIQNLQ